MSTEKLYYRDVNLREFQGEVLSCEKKVSQDKKSTFWEIELNRTAFYPEGGGQPGDRGMMEVVDLHHIAERQEEISQETPEVPCDERITRPLRVLDTREEGGRILHLCDAPIEVGTTVTGRIDWKRRFDHMQQHSGEHIVSGMICSTYDCDNVGFHMGEDLVTIDYNREITWEQLLDIEARANAYIWENHPCLITFPKEEELAVLPYRSKKELEGEVRITSYPGADCCACCGTHVETSAQVGLVKFLSVQKFRNGVRIELLCGRRAYDYLSRSWEQNRAIAQELSTNVHNTSDAFHKVRQELVAVKQKADRLEEAYYRIRAREYAHKGNVLVVEEEMTGEGPRKLCDLIADSCEGRCMLFAGGGDSYRYVVIHKGEDIRALIKDMNAQLHGRGGGRDGFAQGTVQATEAEIRAFYETL